MTTPKSPEQVVKEYEILLDKLYERKPPQAPDSAWLRSSMASLLCYMAERMPKYKDASYKAWSEPKDPVEDLSGVENELRSRRALAYNTAIDDCRTLLIEEARKIIEK